MPDSRETVRPPDTGEVISFDDALLEACPTELRAALLEEAAMLVRAFAPEGRTDQLTAMATALSSGPKSGRGVDRMRARRLAAALRRLADDAQN